MDLIQAVQEKVVALFFYTRITNKFLKICYIDSNSAYFFGLYFIQNEISGL